MIRACAALTLGNASRHPSTSPRATRLPSTLTRSSSRPVMVSVDCNVPDATLWIDDALVGTTASWKGGERQIRAGFHRIEVRHPGYYSFFQEVELPGGSHVVVTAKLRELVE